ncbi:hypothetical protein EYF80_015610 [Liparis tanakae]|uniref:Uncharacterized protein n=1 Tax=Liparis tanakae TaxID=230148 RepID=A0A4Z2I9T8_9TELE|nr:hypothetical protein EYF80_015610 [Liparis tanakae]
MAVHGLHATACKQTLQRDTHALIVRQTSEASPPGQRSLEDHNVSAAFQVSSSERPEVPRHRTSALSGPHPDSRTMTRSRQVQGRGPELEVGHGRTQSTRAVFL